MARFILGETTEKELLHQFNEPWERELDIVEVIVA